MRERISAASCEHARPFRLHLTVEAPFPSTRVGSAVPIEGSLMRRYTTLAAGSTLMRGFPFPLEFTGRLRSALRVIPYIAKSRYVVATARVYVGHMCGLATDAGRYTLHQISLFRRKELLQMVASTTSDGSVIKDRFDSAARPTRFPLASLKGAFKRGERREFSLISWKIRSLTQTSSDF